MEHKCKKSVIGPVISVFVLVLVVAILAGLTFLFVTNLKTTVATSTQDSNTVVNETGSISPTGYTVANAGQTGFSSFSVILINNQTGQYFVNAANYSIVGGTIIGNGRQNWTSVNITYSYQDIANANVGAYSAINGTENAGFSIISYLPLIFLALIFGAVLTLVLKIILPYINLGQQIGG